MGKQRKHKWTQEDMSILGKMKQVGIRNLTPKEKARMNYIFTYETGLP